MKFFQSYATSANVIRQLEKLGIINEITGSKEIVCSDIRRIWIYLIVRRLKVSVKASK